MARDRLDELTRQLERLRAVLAQHGIREEEGTVLPETARPDYIPHGSEAHARFLGLVEVKENDTAYHLVSFTSPRTGRTYRLEDEMGAIRFYPSIDPEKAIRLVLQQKVNELETAPTVPEDAPPMFRPVTVYPT